MGPVKRLSAAALFLIFSAGAASGFSVEKIQYFPREFYVGDTVRVAVGLRLEPGENLLPPSRYPQADFADIRRVSLDIGPESATVLIDVVTWMPGEIILPPLPLGDLTLDSIPVSTRSLLKDRDFPSLQRAKPPLLLPGTKTAAALFAALAAVCALILFPGVRTARGLVRRIKAARLKRIPLETLKKALGRLAQENHLFTLRETYLLYSRAVRDYLSAKEHADLRAKTTSEIRELFSGFEENDPRSGFSVLLSSFDAVKFAGAEPPPDRIREDRLAILRTAEIMERDG